MERGNRLTNYSQETIDLVEAQSDSVGEQAVILIQALAQIAGKDGKPQPEAAQWAYDALMEYPQWGIPLEMAR